MSIDIEVEKGAMFIRYGRAVVAIACMRHYQKAEVNSNGST